MIKNSDVNPFKKDSEEKESKTKIVEMAEEIIEDKNTDSEKQDADNDLSELLEKKDTELIELMDRLQRSVAEFDNYRKRTQKEKERIYVDAIADVVSKFIPVVDNLERALDAAEKDEGEGLKEGVSLVFRQMIDALDKLQVKPIEAVGSCFDPEIHNAVMHIEDDSMDCNIIVEEFQKGYIYKDDIVIRHSVVKVAN